LGRKSVPENRGGFLLFCFQPFKNSWITVPTKVGTVIHRWTVVKRGYVEHNKVEVGKSG
jgi:hypothetical protein